MRRGSNGGPEPPVDEETQHPCDRAEPSGFLGSLCDPGCATDVLVSVIVCRSFFFFVVSFCLPFGGLEFSLFMCACVCVYESAPVFVSLLGARA